MITEKYITAYKNFVNKELELISIHQGEEYAKRMTPYYSKMYESISKEPQDYVPFEDSN